MGIYFNEIRFGTITSTQDYLRDHADELLADMPQVVIADEQTKGRGTHNRMWASPPHVNIYATFGCKIPPCRVEEITRHPNHTAQLVAVCVLKTLQQFGLRPEIKWVNDVWVDRAKIAGILCEPIRLKEGGLAGLIGIGLNVNMEKEVCETLDQPVTSMKVVLGRECDKNEVLRKLIQNLQQSLELWMNEGFLPFVEDMNQYMAFKGEIVRIKNEETGTFVIGRLQGVDPNGSLLLQLEEDRYCVIEKGRLMREKGVDVTEDGKTSLFTERDLSPTQVSALDRVA